MDMLHLVINVLSVISYCGINCSPKLSTESALSAMQDARKLVLWKVWKSQHSKVYESTADETMAFYYFERNLELVRQTNCFLE